MAESENKQKSPTNSKWADFKETKFFKVITNKYFIATFIFFLVVFFIDSNNLINWGANYYKVVQQEKVIKQYKKDIHDTDEKLKELTSDKDSLEKFAREHYYFQEKGEEVFIVKDEK